MSWEPALEIVSDVFLLGGVFFALVAAIGLLRFPDLFTRMHAATKPQTLGLLMLLVGVGLRLGPGSAGVLVLTGLVQLMTVSVATHMVARRAIRTTPVRHDLLIANELYEHRGAPRGPAKRPGDTRPR